MTTDEDAENHDEADVDKTQEDVISFHGSLWSEDLLNDMELLGYEIGNVDDIQQLLHNIIKQWAASKDSLKECLYCLATASVKRVRHYFKSERESSIHILSPAAEVFQVSRKK